MKKLALNPQNLETTNCGAYPENYQTIVQNYFTIILKDPYSANYRFSPPYKAYLRKAPITGGAPEKFGYIVEVWVNAKNSFGGYTGEKFYRVFIRPSDQTLGDWTAVLVSSNPWFPEPWYRE